jgi:hypothetical protein
MSTAAPLCLRAMRLKPLFPIELLVIATVFYLDSEILSP